MGNSIVAILITFGNYNNELEFRLAYLDHADAYLDQDLWKPKIQAHFVIAFHDAPVFHDYDEALIEASDMAIEIGPEVMVGGLNYSQYDFSKFMGIEFARKLIEGKDGKKGTRPRF